jgi:hypothetical protein
VTVLTHKQQQIVTEFIARAKAEGLTVERTGAARALGKPSINWDIEKALEARRRGYRRSQGELRRDLDHRARVAAAKQAAAALAVLRRQTAIEKADRRLDAGTIGQRIDLAIQDARLTATATAVSRWGGQGDRQPGGDPLDQLGELDVAHDARERAATATRFGRATAQSEWPPGAFDPHAFNVQPLIDAINRTINRAADRADITLPDATVSRRADQLLAALALGPPTHRARVEAWILGDLLRLEAVLDYGSDELPTYARAA